YQFGRLIDATGGFSNALADLGRRAELVMDALKFGFFALTEGLRSAWYGAMADILLATEETFGPILRIFGVSAESMAASIENAIGKASEWGKIAQSSGIIAAEQFRA